MNLRKLAAVTGVAVMALTLGLSPAAWMPISAQAAVAPVIDATSTAVNAEADLPGRAERRILPGLVESKGADSFVLKLRNGRTVTVSVNRATRFVARQRRQVSFADLQAGMRVNVTAMQRGGTTLALIVQITPPARAVTEQHLGNITAVSTSSITIHGIRSDKGHTARIVADTKVMPVGTTLAVGDRVVAVYVSDPDSTGPNARIALRITKVPVSTATTPPTERPAR